MGAVQNYVSVSRRPPDVEDYIDMLRRHRSWIIGPTYAGLVIAVVVAFLWPDTFESSAVLRITPQVVSERVVPDTLDLQMVQLIDGLRTKILSRTFLTVLITDDKLKLYPRLVQRYTMEDAIAQMQKDVTIQPYGLASAAAPGHSQGAFIVKFRYPDKYKARQVVEKLVTEFVNQNVTLQGDSARLTRGFLTDQVKDAKDKLDAIQTNIARFREQNSGRLPDNAVYNANQLATLEGRVGAADDKVNSLQMERRNLENTLQSNQDMLTYMTSSAEETAPAQERANQELAALDRQIQLEEANLAALRQTYRDTVPDIKRQQAKIDNLKQQRAAAAAKQAKQEEEEQAAKPDESNKKSPDLRQTATVQQQKDRMSGIQTQIDNVDHEIQRSTDAKAQIEKQIQAVRAKIEASPAVDQQYNALTQDLNFAKANYEDLIRKEKESATTQEVQERHLGEQLDVLDPASLPGNPVEPNRWAISGAGIAMGLMLGLVLAGAQEAKDTSLKNLKDVRAYTNLPVLSSIPLLENALLVRRKRRLFWLAWTTAIIVGSAAMFISMTYYMTPKAQ
jgi:polysaccharide chain length determinant protein (PEP-CTERM system associated)